MINHVRQIRGEPGLLTVAIAVATSVCLLAGSPPGGQPADWVTYSHLPKYPSFAQHNILKRSHGGFFGYFPDRNPKGIFVLRVHIKTGRVKEVMVARTTGERILDAEAVKALREWRFKPGALPHVKEIWLGRDDGRHRRQEWWFKPDAPPNVEDGRSATEDCLVKVPVQFML